jgi:cytochrome b subunit of formate dehydrogenase
MSKPAATKRFSTNVRKRLICCGGVILALCALATVARAQDEGTDGNQGIDSANYNIRQSVEFGYRANEINGNRDTYDTFVNLEGGVRLFDYTLDMHALSHNGLLFDNLSFSNFGYGGDPSDVSRLHIDKNKWYDFHLLFRRDKNFWDYNLFVNPLNPAALNPVGSATSGCIVSPPTSAHPGLPGYCSNPSIADPNSPHGYDLVRRMQDYDLTLLPESAIRFRLGYSHDREEGPGFFTTDSGTVPDFPENYKYTMDAYRFGVDFRVLPRTTISYDQFFNYFKQDNAVLETPATAPENYGYQLSNGTPVDLGIVWSTQTPAEALPCAAPITNAATIPPTANANCNGFLSYSQVGKPHLALVRRDRVNWREMLPRWRDLQDLGAVLLYNLGFRETRPAFGRFSYVEKIEYLAFLWGTVIMAVTGFLLWFNSFTLRHFPKWVADAATTLHFYEAILATCAIAIWHMYTVVFDPDVYPMDRAWLDGKASAEHLAKTRPAYYAEIARVQGIKAGQEPDEKKV